MLLKRIFRLLETCNLSTLSGKETVNATLPIGLVMCRAIRAYHRKTGFKVVT